MTINRKHIDSVFSQRFSLLDLKMVEKYFEDEKLNEEARLVVKEQWEQFRSGSGEREGLDDVFYKFYYTIDNMAPKVSPKSGVFLKISRIAAVLIAAVLIAAAVYFSRRETGSRTNLQIVEFASHEGFRSQFKLPDGTTGWLGYGSQLRYHVDDMDQRIVELDGLAFFDVNHQTEHPFIVKTPAKLNVEVLGTMFNVSAYSEEEFCQIVLQRGKVKLALADGETQNMQPDECVNYNRKDNTFEKNTVKNIDDFLAWKDGKLILKDISLKEACTKLSRFYNIDFELQAEGLDDMEIQLTLENEPLENALNLLNLIAPISCQIKESRLQNGQFYSKKKVIIKNNQPM